MSNTPDSPTPVKHTRVLVLCGILGALGLVAWFNHMMKVKNDAIKAKERPPFIMQLKHNLEAIEMRGQTVNIGQLEGKVWIVGFLYTQCPRGCLGLAAQMKGLQEKFKGEPRFHLVSVSLNAETDTPELLREWTQKVGIGGDNWWFLTGDGPKLRGYMKDEFRLPISEMPAEQRASEFDKWDHKIALVLVDSKRRIRGTYDFSVPATADLFLEKLEKDIAVVLAE